MHPADAAGGEDVHPRAMREVQRRGDRGGAIAPARDRDRKIARRDLPHAIAREKSLELIRLEPERRNASRHRGDRRHRAVRSHRFRHSHRRLPVGRDRETLGQHRAFQSDDGAVGV